MSNQANRIAQVQTSDRVLQLIQSNISRAVDPMLANSLTKGTLLSNVSLDAGLNIVNHKLGRNLIGWFLVRQRGPASTWDSQDSNSKQDLTLWLNSSAPVTVDLYVF